MGRPRQADDVGYQAKADDDPVGDAPGQLERASFFAQFQDKKLKGR